MKKKTLIFVLIAVVLFTNVFTYAESNSGKYINRSEFVNLLHKALNIKICYFKAPNIKDFYKDVSNEDDYSAALYDLTSMGIIDYKGLFKPKDTIPREEMVHFIMNAYKRMTSVDMSADKPLNSFSDKAKINPAYLNDVNQAAKLGLVKGRAKNSFFPKDKTTKAEADVIIDRLMKAINKATIEKVQVEPSYEIGNGLFVMKLKVTNNSASDITINHSSGQKYDFVLLDSDKKELYRWSMGKMFTMMVGNTIIKAGKSVDFSAEIDLASNNDLIGKAAFLKAYIVGQSNDFTINPDGYEIAINS